MAVRRDGKVYSWASQIDHATLSQAHATARLPIVAGHVALMPDAHLGVGATVGSVIPTRGAIIPAAVGVDIGCGMVAAETSLTAGELPDDLRPLLDRLSQEIPAGKAQAHDRRADPAEWTSFLNSAGWPAGTQLDQAQQRTAAAQFGTLGSGNHFVELCVDERERVWWMLHSGSRGAGNRLAQRHIARAKGAMRQSLASLGDPDLAYFTQGTAEFDAYIADVQWAQAYASGNRLRMMSVAVDLLAAATGRRRGDEVITRLINCHHNYAARERHGGVELWITRKGAILARDGDWGIIPGSMGGRSFIVRGKGNPESYCSCSHGAGRAMSRRQARKRFTDDDLTRAMAGRTWLSGRARKLVDEIPMAYKDIDVVMADQSDLVSIAHELTQVLNYKGT